MQHMDRGCNLVSCAWLLLAAASASWSGCTPTQIVEERFQSRQQTCYEFPQALDGGAVAQNSFWSDTHRRDGCETATPASPSAALVSTGPGSSPSSPPPPGSAGGAPDAGVPRAVATVTETPAPGVASTSPLPAGCQEQQILERFARPASMGGCTDPGGLGCHEAVTGEDPVLAQPSETLARLLDQRDAKGCERVWIPSGAKQPEDAFLYRRLAQNVSEEDCEVQMPLLEEPLDDATLQCIGAWIVWVANGRQP